MDDFKFTPDEVQPISSNDDLGFSFTPDEVQPDFSKVSYSDVKTSNDPIGLLTQTAKNLMGMFTSSSLSDAGEAAGNVAYNVGKGIIDNKETVGTYLSELPMTTLKAGMKAGDLIKETFGAAKEKVQEAELYQFEGDTKLAGLKELPKAIANEAMVTTPKMVSEITYWLSKNMADPDGKDNSVSQGFADLSTAFGNISKYMGDVEMFKSTAVELPNGRLSWGNIFNLAGHGVGQGVVMGTMARVFGPKAAYGVYAMAGGAGVFKESYEKEGDLGKANTLASITSASTYMLDRWIDPLPENIAAGAKLTAKEIAKDITKAAMKEPYTEGLQQLYAENLVRKIGIDAEQDLFEGVVESMISAFAGGATMGAVGGVGGYIAEKSFEKAKQKALDKGATNSEVEQYKAATIEKLKQHTDAFDAKFQANAEQAFNDINAFVMENGSEEEVRKALEKKQQLETIYNDTFNELKNIMPEQEAKSNAALVRNSAFFFAEEYGISPSEFIKQHGAKIVRSDYEQFRGGNQNIPVMQVTQKDINYARSHPEWAKNNAIITAIGQAGADINDDINTINKALKEYSIKEYNFRKNADEGQIANFVAELDEGKQERYAMMVENGVKPQDAYNAVTYTEDYIPFQTGVSEIDSSQLYQNLPQDLKNAVDFIYTSAPVYEVTGKEFPNDGTSLNKRVLQYFTDKFQNAIDVSDLGEVLLDARSIKDSTIHGLSSNKANAFAAVPYVLKNGKMFLSQEHYEGKNENRYVFVAPIKLKNEDYFCEVVVRQGIETQKGVEKLGKRRFYIHEVELIKKLSDDFTTFQQGSSSSSKSIISKQINDVKKNMQSQGGVQFQESLNIAVENAELDKVNPAYEGETININGVERTVYNSNGDRIAQSEPALRNFYKWFGDSKVVDEQGRPKVVYHGTNKEFDSFNKKLLGTTTLAYSAKQGFFFTDSEEVANSYGDYAAIYQPINELRKKQEMAERWGDWDTVDELTIKIEELDRKISQTPANERGQKIYPVYLKAEDVLEYDAKDEYFSDIGDEINDVLLKAKKQGKDGVVLKNLKDQPLVFDEKSSNHFVVFEPNQIKSTSNRGTYSESDNIYYQSAFAGSRVDYDRPSLEAIGSGEGAQAHGWGLYYALSKDIAEGYRKTFIHSEKIKKLDEIHSGVLSDNVEEFAKAIFINNQDIDESVKLIESMKSKSGNRSSFYDDAINFIKEKGYLEMMDLVDIDEMVKGQVHEVDIPENPYLLDEQKKLTEQSDYVKERLYLVGKEAGLNMGIYQKEDKFFESVKYALGEEGVKLYKEIYALEIQREIYKNESPEIFDRLDDLWDKAGELERNAPRERTETFDANEIYALVELDNSQNTTGGAFYDRLSEALGSDKDASLLLNKYGIKGITYEGQQDGRCFVIFNPDDVKVIQKFYQDGANDPQGAYVNRIIHLFQNADASTLPHELAHFWKDTLKDVSKMSKRAAKMLEDVEKWSNQEFDRKYSVQLKDGRYVVNNKQGLTVYDHNFRTADDAKSYAQEEIFAQGFETYLKEGVAPNNSLKQAFRNFLSWLKHLLNQGKVLDIRLSPAIKEVYADILGGADIDFFLNTDPDTFIENRIRLAKETEKTFDDQIAEAQRTGVTLSEPDGRGFKHLLETAMIPLSTRLGRISNKLKNRLRRYEFDIANSLNHYYDEARPFLNKWKTFSEADTIAFDIALKNDYVKKQLEIVDKYGAREEWEKVRKLLLDIFDKAVKAGLDINYRPDYFPRKVKDAQGLLSYLRGRPEWTKFEEALKEADLGANSTAEERANFIDKYLRGFIKTDLMPNKYGSEKTRNIEHITNEMNKYYAPSMESLVSYIEGMNARIEASKFLGRDVEKLDESIGGYLDYLMNNHEIDPNKVDEVKEILRARFGQKGVGNKWIAGARNLSYMYTMGGINSAITQIEDLSVAMYKAGIWNTLTTAFENKKIKRADLGLDKISAEFVENPSKTARGVEKLFKLTGLDKIDSFGKETLVNAMVKKFKQMSETSLRQYIEPIMEQETTQTIQDIKNGELSDNVLYLVFSELSDVQPISLSELPAFYNTSGNLRILYMLKSFMVKRIDIFRNECFDKLRSKNKETRKQGMQNLFRLALLMIFCGASKDWLINLLYGRKIDLPETLINNALGLVGFSKFHAYQLRDKGAGEVIKDFLMPPIFAPYDDLLGDVVRIGRGKRDLKDAESLKGIPLFGRFYYWHIGRGKEKMKKRSGSKLK